MLTFEESERSVYAVEDSVSQEQDRQTNSGLQHQPKKAGAHREWRGGKPAGSGKDGAPAGERRGGGLPGGEEHDGLPAGDRGGDNGSGNTQHTGLRLPRPFMIKTFLQILQEGKI